MDPRRSERVAEAIREEIEEIVNYELSDPRVAAISVTEVVLPPGGRRTTVRVALNGSPDQQKKTLAALEGARRHIRSLLAARLDLFRIPDLRFEPDLPVELRSKARQLLRRARKGRSRNGTS